MSNRRDAAWRTQDLVRYVVFTVITCVFVWQGWYALSVAAACGLLLQLAESVIHAVQDGRRDA